ncbi:hypothetical protein [Crocinitomix algicola]|uniref:hypothetical protein n=1 Tax=Crocinitomix algicola TaxID=1740263 RepID=UPI00082E780A|nr:hypothetical protein [Crocinitomix algicola]
MDNNPFHRLVKHEKVASKELVELLSNTLIGTNGTLYQLLDTPRKIYKLNCPNHFCLYRNDKVVANVTLCQRDISLPKSELNSFYIRYVAFSSLFQGNTKPSKGRSSLHDYFKGLFETSNLSFDNPERKSSFFWAYIDPENYRSYNLNTSFGFQTIGSFKTIAFSKVRPKNRGVEVLNTDDHTTTLKDIRNFYDGYALFSTTHLFKNENYFVLRINDEIVAGIQANPVHWKIKKLPGLKGKLMLRLAPYIPYLNKIINPKSHRYLATEGLFWKTGKEHFIQQLLEGVLAITRHHSLLIWEDENHQRVKKLPVKWGFLQKNKVDNSISIVAKMNGFSATEIEAIKRSPKYISGFDVT